MSKRFLVWLVVGAAIVAAGIALTMPAPAVNKNIGNEELVRLQSRGAWVIDVRTASEYIAGHIPDAANVPLEQIQEAASTWSKDQPVVVYCATGARSANAAAYLAGQGFRKVYNLEKGIVAWNGDTVGGQSTTGAPTGAGSVETNGKAVFIDFAGSA